MSSLPSSGLLTQQWIIERQRENRQEQLSSMLHGRWWIKQIKLHPHSQAGYPLKKNPTWSSQCALNVHGSVPLLTLFWLLGASFSLLLKPHTLFKSQFGCLLGGTVLPPPLPIDLCLARHWTPGCPASDFMENILQTLTNEPCEISEGLTCFFFFFGVK